MTSIRIETAATLIEREPLVRPFGFKGGFMTEIWQTAARLTSTNATAIGLCTHNVLWSDSKVFAAHSAEQGDEMMAKVTEFALRRLIGRSFESPIDVLNESFPEIYQYACEITGTPQLRKTFVLNALVGVDNALWTLYFKENGCRTFDDIIPADCREALSFKNDRVAAIPLMAYSIPISEIEQSVDSGYFFMKIKIGQPGTQEEMLAKDMERLSRIHEAIGHRTTDWSTDGRLPYYFDANGRYEKKETLLRLLDHAEKIGALEQIVIVEEPFDEMADIDVHDIPVRLAADESAHTTEDALERIERGYRAMALKPAAKTLSMSMKIAQASFEKKIPCFVADLTVNPILVDWNKNIAARLAPFPGLQGGLLESNGHQNYCHWQTMLGYLPDRTANWVTPQDGAWPIGSDFYEQSGNIFRDIPHYLTSTDFRTLD